MSSTIEIVLPQLHLMLRMYYLAYSCCLSKIDTVATRAITLSG